MSLWNVAGALQSPYDILRNSYTPMLPTVKAVYCWESLAILTCQKPNFKSMVEKNWVPTIDSMVSCIRGRGYASFLVWLFSLEINAEPEAPILLADEDHRIAPRGLGWADHAPIQHFLDMFLYLLHQWRGYAPELFLKRLGIQQLDYMFHRIHTPLSHSAPRRRYCDVPSTYAQTSGLTPGATLLAYPTSPLS